MTNKQMEKNCQEFIKWIVANIEEVHVDCDLIHQKGVELGIFENFDVAGLIYGLSTEFMDYSAGHKIRDNG